MSFGEAMQNLAQRYQIALPTKDLSAKELALAKKRQALINHVTIKDLWDVLNTEQEWIDLETMTVSFDPKIPLLIGYSGPFHPRSRHLDRQR